MIGAVTGVLTDVAGLFPATSKPVIRRGSRGHYVKVPGEHHAIVPLRKVPQRDRLTADQFRLWELVSKAYLAAHLPDGIDARTSITAEVNTVLGAKRFSANGSVVREPGWRAVYGSEAEVEADVVPGKEKRESEATLSACRPCEMARPQGQRLPRSPRA